MLLVNSTILKTNIPKTDPNYEFAKEYTDGIDALKARFPEGTITLRRKGFPQDVPQGDRSGLLLQPETASPIFIRFTITDPNGVIWSYVKGRPKIGANGLVEPNPNDDTTMLDGDIISLDWKRDADYAFFIWYKSRQIENNYYLYDPEGTRRQELQDKANRMRVQTLIWSDMPEEKLKLLAQSWQVPLKAGKKDKDILALKQDLEDAVFKGEEATKKDLQARGIKEFLVDVKADEIVRPKALVFGGIKNEQIIFDDKRGRFYLGDEDICFVPTDKQDATQRDEYLLRFLLRDGAATKWPLVLRALVNKEYVDACDKYGIRWLAEQLEIPLNQGVEALKNAIYKELGFEDKPEEAAE